MGWCGAGSTKLSAPGTSVDRSQVRTSRGDDRRIQLGLDVVHVPLLGLLRSREVAVELAGRVRACLLVRMREHRLRSLQVGPEPVDAMHPGRSLHRLRVLRDQRKRIRVVLEVLHQAEHRRDFRRVCGGLHDAVELGGEAGGVEDDGRGLTPLHENDQHSDQERRDHDQQDDGQGEQRAREELVDEGHRSLSEVHSAPQSLGER